MFQYDVEIKIFLTKYYIWYSVLYLAELNKILSIKQIKSYGMKNSNNLTINFNIVSIFSIKLAFICKRKLRTNVTFAIMSW